MMLIRPITTEEFFKALCGIDDLKAPGCDGFNSYFFKKFWHVVGEEIIDTIMQLFEMYLPINNTSITFIPKVKYPTSVREYRPISCCTIMYKIISKLLTNKL